MAAISSAFITETVGGVQRYLDALMKESLSKYHDAIVAGGGDGYTKWFGRIESFKDVEGFAKAMFPLTEVPKVFMGEKRWLINASVVSTETKMFGNNNWPYSAHYNRLCCIDNYGNKFEISYSHNDSRYPTRAISEHEIAYNSTLLLNIEKIIAGDTSSYSTYPLSDSLIKKYKGLSIAQDSCSAMILKDLAKSEYEMHILRTKMRELEEASRSKDARILELEAELKALRTPPTVDLLGILDS